VAEKAFEGNKSVSEKGSKLTRTMFYISVIAFCLGAIISASINLTLIDDIGFQGINGLKKEVNLTFRDMRERVENVKPAPNVTLEIDLSSATRVLHGFTLTPDKNQLAHLAVSLMQDKLTGLGYFPASFSFDGHYLIMNAIPVMPPAKELEPTKKFKRWLPKTEKEEGAR